MVGSRWPANGPGFEIEGQLRLEGRAAVVTPGPVISRWRSQSARSPGRGGGGISGVIGGLLISGTSSSSSSEPSISGASGARDGSLMIMGSPGGRPGGLGTGSGIVCSIVSWAVRTADSADFAIACIGLPPDVVSSSVPAFAGGPSCRQWVARTLLASGPQHR
jgi:hypothetical protein